MAEGLTGFTHLFNAMRPLSSREPGPIAQALELPDACYGLIVDGVHVDPAMLRLALRGRGRPLLVTDAMPPVGGRRSDFTSPRRTHRRPEWPLRHGRWDARRDRPRHGDCRQELHSPAGRAVAGRAALRVGESGGFLGLGHTLGRLVAGYRADLVAFDPDEMTVLATWVAGAVVNACTQSDEQFGSFGTTTASRNLKRFRLPHHIFFRRNTIGRRPAVSRHLLATSRHFDA